MRDKVDQFITLWADVKAEVSRIVRCMADVRLGPGSRASVNYFGVDDEGIYVNVVWQGCMDQFEWHVPRCYFGADSLSIEKREVEVKQVEDKRQEEAAERARLQRQREGKHQRRIAYERLRSEFEEEYSHGR
jgi:hypothetical protein